MVLTNLILVAFIIETVLNIFFNIEAIDKVISGINFPVKLITSAVFGVAIAFQLNLDIFPTLFSIETSTVGVIVTGLIVSRGSNVVHDFIEAIRSMGLVSENKGV